MGEELEGYLTVSEIAQRMGRSTEQVRRYLREGKLSGKRLGGQWFIQETATMYLTGGKYTGGVGAMDRDSFKGPVTGVVNEARLALFERINARREEIRRRWARARVRVDAADLIREIREERP